MIFPKVEIINNKKVQKLLNQTKAFTRDEFSKLLFKFHNIIRNNDKLSPEVAFDEISKFFLLKYAMKEIIRELKFFFRRI